MVFRGSNFFLSSFPQGLIPLAVMSSRNRDALAASLSPRPIAVLAWFHLHK